MSWASRLFGNEAATSLGWTTAEMLAMMGGAEQQTWLVDRGYRFVFALMPLAGAARGIVDFDAASMRMRLANGADVAPIGLAVCLDEDFRGRVGQKLPSFFSTTRIAVHQQTGRCYAPVYVLTHDQAPLSIEIGGQFVELAQAPAIAEGSPGGPDRTLIEVKSKTSLRDHVPFAHEEASLRGFEVCDQPVEGPGIVAAGSFKDMSVVVARMSTAVLAHRGAVRSQDISAKMRDGTSVKALGMVVHISMAGAPPFGWGDKLAWGPRTMSLEAGGTVTYMHSYAGPFSAISEADCKVAAVFPAQVQLKDLLEIVVGSQRAGLRDGTLIREGGGGRVAGLSELYLVFAELDPSSGTKIGFLPTVSGLESSHTIENLRILLANLSRGRTILNIDESTWDSAEYWSTDGSLLAADFQLAGLASNPVLVVVRWKVQGAAPILLAPERQSLAQAVIEHARKHDPNYGRFMDRNRSVFGPGE